MRIGNIAHASGFVLGVLIGWAIAPGPLARRVGAGVGLVVIVAGFVAVAGWFRADVNLSASASDEDGYRGSVALGDKNYELAARHLRHALALDPADADDWYNYGIALTHVPDPTGLTVFDAWKRAHALRPDDAQIRAALAGEYVRRASALEAQGKTAEAAAALEQAKELEPARL